MKLKSRLQRLERVVPLPSPEGQRVVDMVSGKATGWGRIRFGNTRA
jgi:hypothetical protein